MNAKIEIFIICLVLLVACQPNVDTLDSNPEIVSLPTLTTTVLVLETVMPSTATPTATDTTTPTPPPPEPSVTPSPTLTPAPTQTPEFMWPTASLLFIRDNNLQQWIPQTGEVKTLAEHVRLYAVPQSRAVVVLRREFVADEEYALVLFHIPTGSEVELSRTPSEPTFGPLYTTISPNGRWLADVTGESRDLAVITVRELSVEGQQLTVSEPVLTVTPGKGWNWPYDQLMWSTENEISWSDDSGIWVADLNSSPIEPVIAIAPSTNTFLFTGPNPANWDDGPSPVLTKFIPYLWSPDGRYLVVQEYFYEYGELRVIERGTNRLAEVPESAIGSVSDGAIWLDETTLIHYQTSGNVQIWQIDPENDAMIFHQGTVPAVLTGYIDALWLFGKHLRFSHYYSLFDLDLETGELIQLTQGVEWPPYWSPDGQYVLWHETRVIDEERQARVFLDDLRNRPRELDNVLGLDSCCWYWYEE